jgi:transcriptional regulator with XRE-family HTH domain
MNSPLRSPPSRQARRSTQEPPLDRRAELSEFLRTRRARLKPEDVGLPDFGRHRRVPGLRREELAQLAGVSVAYYTRLEQGNGRNVSAEVLDSIARALRLTDAEHAHLTHLAKPKQHKKKPSVRPQQVRVALRELIDTFDGVPGVCRGPPVGDSRLEPDGRGRLRRLVGGASAGAELGADGVSQARVPGAVRGLGSEGVRHGELSADGRGLPPDDPRLSALVGELSVKSEEFRRHLGDARRQGEEPMASSGCTTRSSAN